MQAQACRFRTVDEPAQPASVLEEVPTNCETYRQTFSFVPELRCRRVWMDLYYSPIAEKEGSPAGNIAIDIETTERVSPDDAGWKQKLRFYDLHAILKNESWTQLSDESRPTGNFDSRRRLRPSAH